MNILLESIHIPGDLFVAKDLRRKYLVMLAVGKTTKTTTTTKTMIRRLLARMLGIRGKGINKKSFWVESECKIDRIRMFGIIIENEEEGKDQEKEVKEQEEQEEEEEEKEVEGFEGR
ncbi:hypothetical protein HZH68_012798 [Vespula germanica]|uniref:Uncharacterized protein n=1 Tax=Vespula germanica TaxID=30212 RepID=A0A834JKK2_VESGE|nr:hypothetical protein HZH68_012798 [Vespula germanica]